MYEVINMKVVKNEIPGSMSFSEGFLGPKRIDQERHYCDYEAMIKYIKSIDLGKADHIDCGLAGDMDCTGCTMFEDGEWEDEYFLNFYDNSSWATPCIVVYYKNKAPETVYLDTNKKQKYNIKKQLAK